MSYEMFSKTQVMHDKLINYDATDEQVEQRNVFLSQKDNYNDTSKGLKIYLGLDEDVEVKTALKKIEELYNDKKIDFDDVTKRTLKNWLKGHYQGGISKRDVMHTLCFALGLNAEESEKFITKVFFEMPFNYRNAYEMIYYFCLKNNHKYSDVKDCIKFYTNLVNDSSEVCVKTEFMRKEIDDSDDTSIDFLKNYLEKYKGEFQGKMQSAKQKAKEWLIKAYGYTTACKRKNGKTISVEDVDVNALLIEIYDFNIKQVENDEKVSIKKDFKFVEYVKTNFPDNQRISNLINDKNISYDALRKIIILMHFFAYCSEVAEQSDTVDYDEYNNEIDAILYESGFGKMYFRNPYDYLFLRSIYIMPPNNDPLVEFRDMFYDMYKSTDTEDQYQ